MNIVICDDDPIYSNDIKNNVERVFFDLHIPVSVKVYTNSNDLWGNIDSYDIAFLDIQMTPHTGIQIAAKLKEIQPNVIIFFITSYEQYLDEAMDLNAFRYIKKPLDAKRLQTGIQKAISYIDNTNVNFYLKDGKKTTTVLSSEIIYIEICGHYTNVTTTNGEYVSDNSISFWKKKLISSSFFHVHKSFIINMKYITEYKRDTVTLCKKYQVPIAYRKQSEFRNFFFNYFGGQ
ncbi:MAG: response regulator transcription factor [Oscillospiraceae bacterium]|nr:response regulator transcription factor [Oscillospiraceae bacterium]